MKGNDVIETGTTEKRVAVAREFVDRVFNGHDGERAREYFTADATFHALTAGTLTGIDPIVPVRVGLIDAPTDIHAEARDVIARNNHLARPQVVKARLTVTRLGSPDTWGPVL